MWTASVDAIVAEALEDADDDLERALVAVAARALAAEVRLASGLRSVTR